MISGRKAMDALFGHTSRKSIAEAKKKIKQLRLAGGLMQQERDAYYAEGCVLRLALQWIDMNGRDGVSREVARRAIAKGHATRRGERELGFGGVLTRPKGVNEHEHTSGDKTAVVKQ